MRQCFKRDRFGSYEQENRSLNAGKRKLTRSNNTKFNGPGLEEQEEEEMEEEEEEEDEGEEEGISCFFVLKDCLGSVGS